MLDAGTVRSLMEVRGLNQSELARLAGVSRQAVSLWFKAGDERAVIHLQGRTLLRLAENLGLRVEDICLPLPLQDDWKTLEAEFLWDRLYPTPVGLLSDVLRAAPRALARLVQVRGLFQAAKIAGPKVWKEFPIYKKHIEPRRRTAWERVWTLQKDLKLI